MDKKMTDADRLVIKSIADNNKVAARIFVTGEVHESYIGDAAVRLLININEVLYNNDVGEEPLFTETNNDTIRMLRFDPNVVWRCFHPDLLVKLIGDEASRLDVHMDPWSMEHFDFYQSMAATLRAAKGDAVPMVKKPLSLDKLYQAVYLSCMLLFGKPGYMGVPAAEHFALRETASFLKNLEWMPVGRIRKPQLRQLRENYKNISGLTNPEMNFVVALYEASAKEA